MVALSFAACKKETKKDAKLDALIKNKDVKGLQAYRDRQKFKLDSLNNVMGQIDQNLTNLGANQAAGIVSTVRLDRTSFVHNIEIQGNVTTDQDVTVQPQFAGTLSLFVKQGQQVSRGQVIGRVADGGLNDQYKQAQIQISTVRAQMAQAQSQANLSRIAFEKQSALWRQKIGSEFQYLQAKANYESAQKQVAALSSSVAATQSAANAVKANLAKTAIVAPFGGVIDQVLTQNGQVVAPGTPIVKLISLGTMRVEAKVPETYLSKVRTGTGVEIFFPTLNKTLKSSVRLVGNFIDPASRTFIIQMPVANDGGAVKPNLLAKVRIQDYVNPNAIQVPSQYIYEDAAHRQFVIIATNANGKTATAKRVFVQTGEKSENSVEITTGLSVGDILVTDGSKNLVDGQKITLQ